MARRTIAVASLTLASLAGLAIVACTVFDGLTVPSGEPPSPEAGLDAGDAGDARCKLASLPTGGQSGISGGSGQYDLVLSVLRLGFDGGVPSRTFGYDLDNSCTCPEPSPCKPRSPDAGPPPCDTDDGRDNAGAVVFQLISLAATGGGGTMDSEAYLNSAIKQGSSSLLLRLADFNGGDDDDDVTVYLFRALGTSNDAGKSFPPTFGPGDVWRPSADDNRGGQPVYFARGFVRKGVLVGELQNLRLPITQDTDLFVTNATFTGRLVKVDAKSFRLEDGYLAGRLPTKELLDTIGKLKIPPGDTHLCDEPRDVPTQVAVDQLRAEICAGADIRVGPGETCNALTTTFGFDAVPVTFGAFKNPTVIPICLDGGIPDCE